MYDKPEDHICLNQESTDDQGRENIYKNTAKMSLTVYISCGKLIKLSADDLVDSEKNFLKKLLTCRYRHVNINEFAAEVANANIENSIVQKFCKYKSFIHTVKYAWMGTSTILKFSKTIILNLA